MWTDAYIHTYPYTHAHTHTHIVYGYSRVGPLLFFQLSDNYHFRFFWNTELCLSVPKLHSLYQTECCSTTVRVVHHRDANLHTPTYTYTGTHPSVFVFEFIFEIETHIFTSCFGFIFKFEWSGLVFSSGTSEPVVTQGWSSGLVLMVIVPAYPPSWHPLQAYDWNDHL